jgi:hypothetical protein
MKKLMPGVRHLIPRMAAAAALILLTACNRAPVQPAKLVGSWRYNAPISRSLTYTFRSDNSFTMELDGAQGAFAGTWRLSGDKLIMTTSTVTNQFGAMNLFGPQGLNQTTHIEKLNNSTMIWREPGDWHLMRFTKTRNRSATGTEGTNSPKSELKR